MAKPSSRILVINDEHLVLREFVKGLNAAARTLDNPLGIGFLGVTTAKEALHVIEADGGLQAVLVDDTLFGFSSSILTALDFATGKVLWRDRSVGKGSLVVADGRLYLFGENGVAGLAEATRAGYREAGRFELQTSGSPTWSHPVVANARLYLRDQDTLYCYDVKK